MYVLNNVCTVQCMYCTMYVLYNICTVQCMYWTMYVLYNVCTVQCMYCTMYVLNNVCTVQCMYNVTPRQGRTTTVAVGKQEVLHILGVSYVYWTVHHCDR